MIELSGDPHQTIHAAWPVPRPEEPQCVQHAPTQTVSVTGAPARQVSSAMDSPGLNVANGIGISAKPAARHSAQRQALASSVAVSRVPCFWPCLEGESCPANDTFGRGKPISVAPSLFTGPESYVEGLFLAMIVSAVESRRTEFSGGTGATGEQSRRLRMC